MQKQILCTLLYKGSACTHQAAQIRRPAPVRPPQRRTPCNLPRARRSSAQNIDRYPFLFRASAHTIEFAAQIPKKSGRVPVFFDLKREKVSTVGRNFRTTLERPTVRSSCRRNRGFATATKKQKPRSLRNRVFYFALYVSGISPER